MLPNGATLWRNPMAQPCGVSIILSCPTHPMQEELRLYQPQLLSCPSLVVANKVDATPDARGALQALKSSTQQPIVPLSAASGLGLERLKQALRMLALAPQAGPAVRQ